MLRYGLEILGVSLGPELHVCRQPDVDRTVEEMIADRQTTPWMDQEKRPRIIHESPTPAGMRLVVERTRSFGTNV